MNAGRLAKKGLSTTCLTVTLLTTALVWTSGNAQEVFAQESSPATLTDVNSVESDPDESPLRPADTSSPRATLRSFLADMDIALDDFQRNGTIATEAGYRARERLTSTLDFSTTPNGNSRMTVQRRGLLLLEILSRIELPPYSEIPGDDEVAHGALNQWTVPNTRITIQRVEEGPRAGEFLFSARTVERLHRNYLLVQHLPYKPGARPGIYEAFISSTISSDFAERMARNRLRPVDTSSPRATLDGLFDSVNRVYALVMEARAALVARPPTMTKAEARETETIAMNLMKRAMSTLDLSKVPKAIRDNVGIESVLQLKEIFDRMLLPPIESVPDLEMVRVERQRLTSTASDSLRPVRWRYPNTQIEIVEIMEGERQGHFLFSADTVSRLEQYYLKVRNLPYRKDYSEVAREYISPGLSEGFYEYYISTPGRLINEHTFLGQLVERLPGPLKRVYGGQTLWQWISLPLWLSLGVLILAMLHGRLLRRPVALSSAGRHWRRVLFNLVAAGTVLVLQHFLDDYINITGSVLYVSDSILQTLFWLFVSLGIFFLGCAIAETIIASPKIDPDGIHASYLRALFGVAGFVACAVSMIYGLSLVGVAVMPLLTSVGIIGLAVALAARPTLESIIGSFLIFADKPYRVGQRVKVMGYDGEVEAIGLRSTKIRLRDSGQLTTIPNDKMSAIEIENIGRRPFIRRVFNVTITYDTPPEKIRRAVEILRDILAVPKTRTEPKNAHEEGQDPHPNEAINNPKYPPRVFFDNLNADSLNIYVSYWHHPPELWDYMAHAHWVNMQIMERFNAEGIDFAFPTQTLRLAGDEKRPLTVGQRKVTDE